MPPIANLQNRSNQYLALIFAQFLGIPFNWARYKACFNQNSHAYKAHALQAKPIKENMFLNVWLSRLKKTNLESGCVIG